MYLFGQNEKWRCYTRPTYIFYKNQDTLTIDRSEQNIQTDYYKKYCQNKCWITVHTEEDIICNSLKLDWSR
jgi:hypothetical protein